MKLLEVAPDFVRSEVGSLMTILQMLQNKVEPGTKIPMQNITNLMNNAGYPFNWRALEGLKKKYKALDDLIGDFDEDSLTLGGEEEPEISAEPEQNGMGIEEPPMNNPDMGMSAEPPSEPEVDIADGRSPERATVDKMAARAARF